MGLRHGDTATRRRGGERLPALTPADYDRLREKWAEKGAKELRKGEL
jgi:hypothetical protein